MDGYKPVAPTLAEFIAASSDESEARSRGSLIKSLT